MPDQVDGDAQHEIPVAAAPRPAPARPPGGGMTAFPWLRSGENSRAFCQAAAEQGILLAPGDCFDEACSSHFRLGFAAITDKFPEALERLGEFVKSWSTDNVGVR